MERFNPEAAVGGVQLWANESTNLTALDFRSVFGLKIDHNEAYVK